MSATYSFIRLKYIDGKEHDFIFADSASAKRAFNRYKEAAERDREKHGAGGTTTDAYIYSSIPIRYELALIKEIEWSAQLFLDMGFSQ